MNFLVNGSFLNIEYDMIQFVADVRIFVEKSILKHVLFGFKCGPGYVKQ